MGLSCPSQSFSKVTTEWQKSQKNNALCVCPSLNVFKSTKIQIVFSNILKFTFLKVYFYWKKNSKLAGIHIFS